MSKSLIVVASPAAALAAQPAVVLVRFKTRCTGRNGVESC
jgi:hypothetical protein